MEIPIVEADDGIVVFSAQLSDIAFLRARYAY